MDGQLIGLVAVILGMGIPLGALYTYYRVRKLRSEERLAAIPGTDCCLSAALTRTLVSTTTLIQHAVRLAFAPA